jgi:NADPH-dependent ferric siderophore reductase
MRILTLEGVVHRDRIYVRTNVRLPENTKVYVIVPDVQVEQVARVFSPRLAHPEQAADFRMEIVLHE